MILAQTVTPDTVSKQDNKTLIVMNDIFKKHIVTFLTILRAEFRTNDFILDGRGIMEKGWHIIARFFFFFFFLLGSYRG